MPDDLTPEVPPEIDAFLRDRARSLDADAPGITLDEVVDRPDAAGRAAVARLGWRRSAAPLARARRGAPALAAAVMAAVLIAGVVGFAAGRGSAPKSTTVSAADTPPRDAGADAASSQGFAFATNGHAVFSSGGGPLTMTRLFLRTTGDGVVLRGYLQEFAGGSGSSGVVCGDSTGGTWCPPPECSPSSSFEAELSNAEAVSMGGTPVFPVDGPAVSRGQVPLGDSEGSPVWATMVQTSDDVINVAAAWPDGFLDQMAPVNGWAIVAHAGSAAPASITVDLRDGGTMLLDPQQSAPYPSQCQPPPPPLPPPPELPAAGEEQPADASAATDAVTNAYNVVFDHSSDPAARQKLIEGWEGLVATNDQSKQNFPQAAESVTVTVGEVRFLSPTDAALYFELKYQGGQLFGQQIGYAKLVDGTWMVARDTMCMVYGWAGAQCDPPPDPARASSSGSAPQPGTYSGPAGATATTTAN